MNHLSFSLTLVCLAGCALPTETSTVQTWNEPVERRFVLENGNGVRAVFSNLGATLVSLEVPGPDGPVDLVLGFDDESGYRGQDNQYFGCTVGRVANRIGGASFSLDGMTYTLEANDGENTLHGGTSGYHADLWAVEHGLGDRIRFTYSSPHGQGGYPGGVLLSVEYRLTEANALELRYEGRTDAVTVLNPTHHSYFNLAGAGAPTVLDHVLQIHANEVTEAGPGLIPTGALAAVEGTPLDFRTKQALGRRIAALDGTAAKGYDHNYVLAPHGLQDVVARLEHPASGRWLEVRTDQPGLQLYSGNFLFGQLGKGGRRYAHRSAVCLEAQGFPDSPNQPTFPSIRLEPGEVYTQFTSYTVGW